MEQLAVVLNMAQATDTRLGLAEVAGQHLKRVKEVMGDRGDVAALYGATREEAGLDFQNKGR